MKFMLCFTVKGTVMTKCGSIRSYCSFNVEINQLSYIFIFMFCIVYYTGLVVSALACCV